MRLAKMGTEINTPAYPAGVSKTKKRLNAGFYVKKFFFIIDDKLGCSSTLISFSLVFMNTRLVTYIRPKNDMGKDCVLLSVKLKTKKERLKR
jgi:hypothetical protein